MSASDGCKQEGATGVSDGCKQEGAMGASTLIPRV